MSKLTDLYDSACSKFGLDKVAQLCPVFGARDLKLESVPAHRHGEFTDLLARMLQPNSIARAQADLDLMDDTNKRMLGRGSQRGQRPPNTGNVNKYGFPNAPGQGGARPAVNANGFPNADADANADGDGTSRYTHKSTVDDLPVAEIWARWNRKR